MSNQKIIAPENMVQTEASVKKKDTVQTESYGIFTILKHNKDYNIAVGMNIVSREVFKKKNDVIKYIDSKPWELMLNTFAIMADAMIDKKIEIINKKEN